MSDTLDEKLIDLIKPWAAEMTDDVVGQIWQAINAAGYVKLALQEPDMDVLLLRGVAMGGDNDLAVVARILLKIVEPQHNLKTAKAYIYTDKSQTVAEQVMPGQEWYDRFAADLHRLRMDEEYQKLHKAESVDWYYSSHYLQAARRAAGLDTEGDNA